MDDRIVAGGEAARRRALRADEARHPRDPDGIGEAKHLLEPMQPGLVRHRAGERATAQLAAPPGVDRPDVTAPGEQREEGRAIAALGRDREVVALEQAQREFEARRGAPFAPASG